MQKLQRQAMNLREQVVSVKWTAADGQCRRFALSLSPRVDAFNQLVKAARRAMVPLANTPIAWKDDEGDIIVLKTDAEVREAVRLSGGSHLAVFSIGASGTGTETLKQKCDVEKETMKKTEQPDATLARKMFMRRRFLEANPELSDEDFEMWHEAGRGGLQPALNNHVAEESDDPQLQNKGPKGFIRRRRLHLMRLAHPEMSDEEFEVWRQARREARMRRFAETDDAQESETAVMKEADTMPPQAKWFMRRRRLQLLRQAHPEMNDEEFESWRLQRRQARLRRLTRIADAQAAETDQAEVEGNVPAHKGFMRQRRLQALRQAHPEMNDEEFEMWRLQRREARLRSLAHMKNTQNVTLNEEKDDEVEPKNNVPGPKGFMGRRGQRLQAMRQAHPEMSDEEFEMVCNRRRAARMRRLACAEQVEAPEEGRPGHHQRFMRFRQWQHLRQAHPEMNDEEFEAWRLQRRQKRLRWLNAMDTDGSADDSDGMTKARPDEVVETDESTDKDERKDGHLKSPNIGWNQKPFWFRRGRFANQNRFNGGGRAWSIPRGWRRRLVMQHVCGNRDGVPAMMHRRWNTAPGFRGNQLNAFDVAIVSRRRAPRLRRLAALAAFIDSNTPPPHPMRRRSHSLPPRLNRRMEMPVPGNQRVAGRFIGKQNVGRPMKKGPMHRPWRRFGFEANTIDMGQKAPVRGNQRPNKPMNVQMSGFGPRSGRWAQHHQMM